MSDAGARWPRRPRLDVRRLPGDPPRPRMRSRTFRDAARVGVRSASPGSRACSVRGPSEDRREHRKDSSLVMRSSSQNRQTRTADGRCQEPGGARVRASPLLLRSGRRDYSTSLGNPGVWGSGGTRDLGTKVTPGTPRALLTAALGFGASSCGPGRSSFCIAGSTRGRASAMWWRGWHGRSTTLSYDGMTGRGGGRCSS